MKRQSLCGRIDKQLRANEEIKSLNWVIGESAPAFYYNMIMNRDGEPGFAEALVTTVSPEATERLIPALQSELDRTYPSAQILVRGLVQGPPVNAPVELRLVGSNIETLRRLGDDARRLLTQVPGITHARAGLIGADPKLKFQLDEDKVRLAGLTLGEVARQMEANLTGVLGGSLIEMSEELPVRVRLANRHRDSIAALRSLMIVGPDASVQAAKGLFPGIPLTALGSLQLVPSDNQISHRNGEAGQYGAGFCGARSTSRRSVEKVQALLLQTPIALPPGYRLEYGGDTDARVETAMNLARSAPLVIILTMVTIFLTFGSYRLSLITLTVALLSMGLSLLALAIFQYPFGIQALIGTIGSIGVSVNAAIIILTALQEDEGAMAGDLAAMRAVILRSSRHIVSTTITTVGGFIPLILGGGGFWPPFAMAIAGGVLLSTVVSFYFTPIMFALVMRPRQLIEEEALVSDSQSAPLLEAAE